ncbi:hypothetical protein AtubIFM55763_009896 [Aspergillus tubingensis]|uniref:Uncharacterized protein n=2 Tax=Aspergillus subgen. Circumdati TaxID=2720871 RepID=A0A8H3SJ75_ASPTU|nr:CFEM domain family protein [Aspergillus tubingensis]GAQ44500.1 similar to An18g06390 [Aspergillus niger]GFN10246.1 CFEM domain family protein [Aspergillus tubingensis]GLA63460.1 hypothetical protein AtubIFM54640_004608 [Aspergillus tubingensis]GLA77706.1 hypothetical protein AtubIFM55763_009896 [Aspergillus tubingensis]GLA80259.1 hypothetical protein AtubIFM56815_001070 [Aspergillus tubingensis]
MATTLEQPAPVERVTLGRSRSARLADQAATAALYVTHPERKLSVREPSTAETELATLKATGSRPGFSHASAVAALAHAQSKGWGTKGAATTQHVEDKRASDVPSLEGYKAAAFVLRDRRSIVSSSTGPSDLKYDSSGAGQTVESRSGTTGRDRTRYAVTGALYANRRRADSAPSEAPHVGMEAGEVLGDLDNAMEASRIQHIANTNARLYTATPPVAPELDEYKRKSILQAAAVSMARDMYAVVEAKEQGPISPSRMRSQRTATGAEPMILQQAFSLQDAAEKRAAEKLASMQDEAAIYREYYGIEPQTTRSSLQVRRRRLSIDSDASSVDAERSKEIRSQMYSLRTKLDAVDERREKDRALLMEAARRNVDATIQDMEMRVYAETGRAPAAMQKELEETALLRAKERQETDAQYQFADRVNISSQKYVDMADVEALARSRLQPTFDEITDRAETKRAREIEQRLDQEEAERREAIQRERDADTRAEERRMRASLRTDSKYKEEKARLWSRKSKRTSENETYTLTGAVDGAADEARAETAPQQTSTEGAQGTTAGAVTETAPGEAISKSESKLRSWFKGRLGRRPSGLAAGEATTSGKDTLEVVPSMEPGPAAEQPEAQVNETVEQQPEPRVVEATGQQPETRAVEETEQLPEPQAAERVETQEAREISRAEPVQKSEDEDGRAWDIAHPEEKEPEVPELPAAPVVPEESEQAAAEDDSRGAALRSHPVTANDLRVMSKRMSVSEGQDEKEAVSQAGHESAGDRRSRLVSGFKKIVSKSSSEGKTEGIGSNDIARRSSQAIPTPGVETEERRASAAEQGLSVPTVRAKRASSGTGRESRFSEKL